MHDVSGQRKHFGGMTVNERLFVAGLIQHGWTTVPPIPVNFGDFPDVEKDGRRKLFVWSHGSRAWDPARSARASFALGSPWAYLVSTGPARRQLAGSRPSGTPRPTGASTRWCAR